MVLYQRSQNTCVLNKFISFPFNAVLFYAIQDRANAIADRNQNDPYAPTYNDIKIHSVYNLTNV